MRSLPSNPSIGLSQLTYALPRARYSLTDLARRELLGSRPEILRSFGFSGAYMLDSPGELDDLFISSGKDLLAALGDTAAQVRRLFLATALPLPKYPPGARGRAPLGLFRYHAARVHQELGLTDATALTVTEQGCSGFLSALELAVHTLAASDEEVIICLAGDALPCGARREVIYNVVSDAACGVVVQKHSPKNRFIHAHTITHTYYWDTPSHADEIIAAYFPLAQRAIVECLRGAGLKPEAVDWFVPHNVSRRSWDILAGLLDIDRRRVWTRNISRIGHTISCDHAINLFDMEQARVLRKGDLLCLFTFGFGASWTALLLRH